MKQFKNEWKRALAWLMQPCQTLLKTQSADYNLAKDCHWKGLVYFYCLALSRPLDWVWSQVNLPWLVVY
jgi:hypothetical protein